MFGTREDQVRETAPEFEDCVSIQHILNTVGPEFSGSYSLEGAIHAATCGTIDPNKVNVPIGEVVVVIDAPESDNEDSPSTMHREKRVMDCPVDVAERCGKCVLNLRDGVGILESIKIQPPIDETGDEF